MVLLQGVKHLLSRKRTDKTKLFTIKNNKIMAIRIPIYKQFVFARLKKDGTIKYFVPQNGGLTYIDENGNTRISKYPTEAQMNYAGWYKCVNVPEDGDDYVLENILYHFTGEVVEEEEP